MEKIIAKLYDAPLYGSRGVDTYIKLIKRNYSFIDIEDLLKQSNIELHQVKDEGHYFSQKQINEFHRRLQILTGNSNIAREAGRYAASPEALGGLRRYVLGLIGPSHAYEFVGKYANRISRSAEYSSNKVGRNKVEITVKPHPGVKEELFQCENRMGYWEAISIAFNDKFPKIEHPLCLFKGDNFCKYIVSWNESSSAKWKRIRNFFAVLSSIACLILPFVLPKIILALSIPLLLLVVISIEWYSRIVELREIKKALDHLRYSSDELMEQINVNYDNSLLISEIGQALSDLFDLNSLLTNITKILQKRLDYDRGLVLLSNSEKSRLFYKTGYGYSDDQLDLLKKINFHLDRPDSKGIFVVSFHNRTPVLLNNIDDVKDDLSNRSYDFAKKMGAKSFICCPIVFENESLGILAVDNLVTKRPLLERDKNLLMGVANQIGISLYNTKLVDAKLNQFQSMLRALVASTDARDPITAGHSLKVTEYSVGICKELGLPQGYCDMIRVASLLHDYGKIGVEDAILKKPGKLDPDEYATIKTHADKTKSILEKIDFEDIYQEVPFIAGAHHEKMDGTGYPNGLKGDEIPLGAKIIAVADVFEALTSKRHYRDPMPINEAFDLLVRDIGTHFDGDCVEAMINYYNMYEAKIPYLHDKQVENKAYAANKWQQFNSTGKSQLN